MVSKRKRARIDFTANAIEKEVMEAKQQLDTVVNFKNSVRLKQLREALAVFKGKAQFDVKVFSRYKNTRFTIISRIVKYLCPESWLTDIVVEEIVDTLEKFAPNMPFAGTYSNDFDDALKAVTKAGEFNVSGLLAPPVDDFLECGGRLCAPNPPSNGILYTTNGPKAVTKIILRCLSCKIYGYAMRSDGDGVSCYYSEDIMARNTVLEVTNVAYIEKALYVWLTSL
ncbi:Hypothetical predicted protein, partial [Paramuricea clavata]